ncbi:hypothetical protein [Oricola indica]|uniref:hypothetical protein n=1 Tax=Oricola indica TaxID=2872591 RepID=UPI003CCBDA62
MTSSIQAACHLSHEEGSPRGRYADPTFSELELAALDWLDGFYQLEHLLSARKWVIRLAGNASEELRFAALTHDAERFFPGGPSDKPQNGFDNPDYLFEHSKRSADIVEEWLRQRDPQLPDRFIERVRALILRHEIGGNPEEDIMQAADSLAFLDSFEWLIVSWIQDGHYSFERVCEKLDWMTTRIRIQEALQLALPIYARIVAVARAAGKTDINPANRRAQAANRAFLLGEEFSG